MVLSGESDEEIYKKHQDLCYDLNMDKETASESWQNYLNIRETYTLEGDQLHWLGCSLYVACRKATAPAVGRATTLIEGNLVSLTRLLRLCNLSLIQFFSKVKKWADMASLSLEFREKISRLERNFAVSMVIFKKFQPIFSDMFVEPTNDQPQQPKPKKQRNMPCTPSQVFDFVWTLFISVKSDVPEVSDDLVNSYHLLLACCDLIFANAVMADRTDLLSNRFPGLPKSYGERTYRPPTEPPCIIYQLCTKHDGILVEAKGIKEYSWKNHIKKLFEKRVLRGDPKNFSGLLDVNNFDLNMKSINKLYEEYVLSVGDFDERIFLGADANTDIGTPTKVIGSTPIGDISEKLQAKRNLIQQVGSISQLTPSTPLTGRKYLKSKETSNNITPVSTATQSVQRLQSLLSGRQAAPSPWLQQIIKNCEEDPQIVQRIRNLGQQFCAQYTQSAPLYPGTHIDFAQKRLQMAESLFYKLLENILKDEINKPNFDQNSLLRHEMFHQTLFACCLEIVIYSYNSQRTFPWVLEALGIEPYHFYKVIEVTVRAEDQLSRDMVKHLNLIEEQILESLAWKGNSPLWEAIEASELPVPSCEDVSLPGQLIEDHISTPTPLNNPAIRKLVLPGMMQSPGPSALERFHSPLPSTIAKKKLFIDNTGGVCTVKPGQSLLNTQSKPKPPGSEEGDKKPATSNSVIINPASLKEKQIKGGRPRRTGSLGLFFRKFYHLASVRMQELCNHLEVREVELRRKIWTCFEHSIVDHKDLMLDRHLDQILMCAVYVMCKIEGLEKPFTEVMKCYRLQPQSASHVYRSVLLASKHQRSNNNESSLPPSERDGNVLTSTTNQKSEERCDIIKFYNSVYVLKLQNFVKKFANGNAQNVNLTLSPLLVTRSVPMSPRRRVSDTHSVFIRPLTSSEPNVFPPSPTKPLSYCFSRSPAKDLRAINSMMRDSEIIRRVGKRILTDDNIDEDGATQTKQPNLVATKIQDLFADRLSAKTQDSV